MSGTLLAAVSGIAVALPAAAQNAVSAVNGKLDLRGGYQRSVNSGIDGGVIAGTGSVTMPLGQSFGFQIDAGIGDVDGNFYGSGGGTAFWRNPSIALVGIFGQASTLDSAFLGRFGGRGEYYASWLTFGGYAGYQTGNRGHSVQVKNGWIGAIDATAYATDNFAIRGAVGVDAGQWYGRAGLEFQPAFTALPGLALFADGGGGQNRQIFGFAGVRYYFGVDKSLKRRHREDDPVALPVAELPQFRKFSRGNGGVGGGGGNDTFFD